jgi:hypothetical protein
MGGCATQAQRQFQAVVTNNRNIAAQYLSCVTVIYNSSEAGPIRARAPLKATDATLAQLSDTSKASEPEIQAIFLLHPKLQECQRIVLNGLMSTTPTLVPILTEQYNRGEDDALMFIQRKLTWGEYAKLRRDRATAVQAELQAEGQKIVAGLQQQHENELAHRQAAAEAFARWAQTQQIINNMNRPVITNCNRFGGMVNCVTQ